MNAKGGSMKKENEKQIEKLLLMLDKNLQEQFNILSHDVQHLKFITTSLKNFSGLGLGGSEESFFKTLDASMGRVCEKVKSVKQEYFNIKDKKWLFYDRTSPEELKRSIFNFNRERIKYVRILSLLSKTLDYMHKTIAEVSYSLPPVIEPTRRYKRKIDRDDLKVLKSILTSYARRFNDLLSSDGKEEKGALKLNPVMFIGYSVSTKLFSRFFRNIDELTEKRDDKVNEGEIDFVMLPYWAVKITEYVSASAHEIIHLYLKEYCNKDKNKGTEILEFKYKISDKLKEIIDGYAIYKLLPYDDIPENDLISTLSEEIIADFYSILIAGPSYYFTLLSQGTARYPLAEHVLIGSAFMYARIYVLYHIIEEIIRMYKDHDIIPGYWTDMFEASKEYMDILTDERTIKEDMYVSDTGYNNLDSVNTLCYKLSIQRDIGKTIAKSILEYFKVGKNKSGHNINKIKVNNTEDNTEEILKVINMVKAMKNIEGIEKKCGKGIKFVSPRVFSNFILGNKYTAKEDYAPENIPEYLWDMTLFHFYNLPINENKESIENLYEKIEHNRLPKLQIARLLGTEERFELFMKNNGRDNNKYEFYLEEPEEWLFARMDWMQLKREGLLNNNNGRCVPFVIRKFREWYEKQIRDDGKKGSDENELETSFILGDYDFLISLKGTSTRKEIEWPPKILIEDNKETTDKNNKEKDNYIAPYTYKEYIVEKICFGKNSEDSKTDKVDSVSKNPDTSKAYVLKFVKFADIKNCKTGKILDFIKKQHDNNGYEIYLSNSWNTFFLKKPIDACSGKELIRNMDDVEQNDEECIFEDIQTFLIFTGGFDRKETGKNNSVGNENKDKDDKKGQDEIRLITIVKTRGNYGKNNKKPNNNSDWLFSELEEIVGKNHRIYRVSGITDYIIEWQCPSVENLYEYSTRLIDKLIENMKKSDQSSSTNGNGNHPLSDASCYFSTLTTLIFDDNLKGKERKNT